MVGRRTNEECSRNRKHECEVCKKVVIGDEQWKQHVEGRVHKRHIAGMKRKAEMEKYFEEKKRKEEKEEEEKEK